MAYTSIINIYVCNYYWRIIIAIFVAMELIAIYYQHKLGYQPCAICIHIRFLVLLAILTAILGIVFNKSTKALATTHFLNLVISALFLERSWELFAIEKKIITGFCSMESPFPNWFALDKWLPSFFEARGLCDNSPEMFLDFTMADILIVIAILYTLIALTMVITSIYIFIKKPVINNH